MKPILSSRALLFAVRLAFLMVLLLLVSSAVFAQGLPGPPPFPMSPDPAPIDGGLGLLAAAGGAYAYKKLRAGKKS
jgi:hypothetical protein